MGYHQLTYRERYLIGKHKSRGESVRTIARMLHRSPSTISRELRRNADSSDGYYRVDKADRYARARRWRSRQGTQFERPGGTGARADGAQVEPGADQPAAAQAGAAKYWNDHDLPVAEGRQGGRRLAMAEDEAAEQALPQGLPSDGSPRQDGRKTPISQRPARVEQRREFGHWEGDTVMGKDGRHCLLTLVERMTRWVQIIKLPARQAVEVKKALAREIRKGVLKMKSLTLDNGTEFHGFRQMQDEFGIEVYFAQPYHSWERGTNENTNGLIRQYLPKGMCFKEVTQRHCDKIERELNDRPRKVLGFDTPNEAYAIECCT
ncbi:IS30 family transposase [Piscinibacter aquaticus]|uniref:IS30 family transposase n=1 Tax=Piscinibacter aquaticus TaxID=392597 RepID=A0A5C6U3Z7_9BURK|nr:IS30 family transposase [Piscinibacter aquaticus]